MNIKKYFNTLFETNKSSAESWNVVLAQSLSIFVSEFFAAKFIFGIEGREIGFLLRFSHAVLAILSITLLMIFKKKWKKKHSIILYLVNFLPILFIEANREITFARLNIDFVPLLSFKLNPFILAFLVPGSYLLNLFLMIILYLEAVFLWFYLDIPHMSNAIIINEPLLSIIFAFNTLLMFSFKYRDKKIIEKLNREKTDGEIYERLAKVLLTIRDQSNTPLQNQKIIISLLKKKSTAEQQELIQNLEDSIRKLTETSELMGKLEPNEFKENYKLMSEIEIQEYLNRLVNTPSAIQ
jgi:hypothetical protein